MCERYELLRTYSYIYNGKICIVGHLYVHCGYNECIYNNMCLVLMSHICNPAFRNYEHKLRHTGQDFRNVSYIYIYMCD